MERVKEGELKLINDFNKAITFFEEIQNKHSDCVARSSLLEISIMSDERSKAMGLVEQTLKAIWSCSSLQSDASLGEKLQVKINKIIGRERELAQNIKSYQSKLKVEMGKMRKGKRVLGGYGRGVQIRNVGQSYKNAI